MQPAIIDRGHEPEGSQVSSGRSFQGQGANLNIRLIWTKLSVPYQDKPELKTPGNLKKAYVSDLKTNNMNGLRFEVAQLSDRFGPDPSAYITISENLEVSA